MKRALLFVVLTLGCAAPRAERAAPSTAPSKPQDYDGTSDKAGTTSTGAEPPTTVSPSAAPVPPGAGGSGTVVMPGDVGKAQINFEDASKAFTAAGNDCAQLCKALGSMTNATEHLCDLTRGGTMSDQQRCTDAKTRLDFARAKVKSSCGAC